MENKEYSSGLSPAFVESVRRLPAFPGDSRVRPQAAPKRAGGASTVERGEGAFALPEAFRETAFRLPWRRRGRGAFPGFRALPPGSGRVRAGQIFAFSGRGYGVP